MKPVIIIGAGPAGLAVAGRLQLKAIPFIILEKSDQVGAMWHQHYDRLQLHTVKEWSHLPHVPFPDDYPRYVTREQLVRYFDQYADHFNIRPIFHSEVTAIEKGLDEWCIRTSEGKNYHGNYVVVATGVNRIPNIPSWKGMEKFNGSISHSRSYKNPTPFLDQKTLVVGMGNTGAEIALDLAEAGINVGLSVRSAVNIVPRDVFGRPVQVTAKKLSKLPLGIGEWIGTLVRKMVMGNLKKYGITTSNMSPIEQLRKTGKSPVIDLGTVEKIKEGKIKIYPDIESLSKDHVQFSGGRKWAVDRIILATGYRPQLDDFFQSTEGLVDRFGSPKSPVGSNKFAGLYFVGFDNYKVGGILGTIYKDSEVVVDDITRSVAYRK